MDQIEEESKISSLKDALKNKGKHDSDGLYAYMQGTDILYIGKGKPIFNRLKSHYREAYREVSGDTKTKRWHRFFEAHTGELTVLWIPVKEETTRKILELALQVHFKPAFEDFR